MRGSLGLVIGLVVGAGGMYLVLRPPWAHHAALVPPDGPPVVVVTPDAAPAKKKPRHHRPSAPGQPQAPGSDDLVDETEPPLPALTAADRALEWRGDEVSLPPQKIDMANGGGGGGGLDDSEISAVTSSQAGPVRDCIVAGATNTDLHATITVKLLVDPSGRVSKSRLQAPHYLFEHGLLGCAQKALGRMHFPSAGGATVVTLPITLG